MFNIDDEVVITLRDEAVEGKITNIDDREFTVTNTEGEVIGTFPNDVGGYVKLKEVE